MQKRWLLNEQPKDTEIINLAKEIKVDSLIASILLSRGINTFAQAEAFFRPSLAQLYDPFLMKNMSTAVEMVITAIANNKKILLYGDYDVDGTCSVAMMYTFFQNKVDHVDYYVPNRYDEGYGVSEKGMRWAIDHQVDLLITLDCGIKNPTELALAKKQGIDIIVCDHHEPGVELPDAILLNPKQKDCSYPFEELCGCGVAFKLLSALALRRVEYKEEVLDLLDFVAVSTGADIVSVLDENRVMCFFGLQRLNNKERLGFDELLKIASRPKPVNLTDVVFTIAPRINAAGRIEDATTAVELMVSKEHKRVEQIAEKINAFNTERRSLDEVTTTEALAQLTQIPNWENKKTNVVAQAGWSKGVVGIVASRLIEKHFRPTVVLTEENGMLTGSARTVNDFDIHSALEQCADLFVKFGGHKHAAGLSLKQENYEAFTTRFEEVVQNQISSEDQSEVVLIDQVIELADLYKPGELLQKVPRVKRVLDQMEPHGPGNMRPVFLAKNLFAIDCRVLKEKHLKLIVCQPPSTLEFPAIGFFMAHKRDEVASGMAFDMAFSLDQNTWKDRTTLQLMVKDIRAAE